MNCKNTNEFYNIRKNVENLLENFVQKVHGEYTKQLQNEIASKNTFISVQTEDINNLSRSHRQVSMSYKL